MIILPILIPPLIHFSLKGWENELFEVWSERAELYCIQQPRQPAGKIASKRSEKEKHRPTAPGDARNRDVNTRVNMSHVCRYDVTVSSGRDLLSVWYLDIRKKLEKLADHLSLERGHVDHLFHEISHPVIISSYKVTSIHYRLSGSKLGRRYFCTLSY